MKQKHGATAAKECTFPGTQNTECAPRVIFRVRCAQNMNTPQYFTAAVVWHTRYTTVLVPYWCCVGTAVLVLYWYCSCTCTATYAILALYWYGYWYSGTVLVLYTGTVLVLSWCYVLVLSWYCTGILYLYRNDTLLLLTGSVLR